MRLIITGGSGLDEGLVADTLLTLITAKQWVLAALIVHRSELSEATTAAVEWAAARGVRVVIAEAVAQTSPDVALIFPGSKGSVVREIMSERIPIYNVSAEGRYTKHRSK